MRAVRPQYPVDRYLVESSKNIEKINIIDDDIWKSEPALKPEDEIILRKLHDMLQSTADDLKLLSGELSKFHEPGVQVKSTPTPLDEEFNEKVHIEEVVNAKFHGYKVINKSPRVPECMPKNDVLGAIKSIVNKSQKPKIINTDPLVDTASTNKKPNNNRKLGLSRTRIVQINENNQDFETKEKLNNAKMINKPPLVAYNEFSYKYVESKDNEMPKMILHVQKMPSINIRSELKEQKVLHLDILPENIDSDEIINTNKNVAVVTLQYDTTPKQLKNEPTKIKEPVQNNQPDNINKPVRKISKMSTCESSESTNNISSDVQIKLHKNKQHKSTIRFSPKTSRRIERNKKGIIDKKESEKRSHLNLDEWKKKLNSVYGPSSYSRNLSSMKSKSNTNKISPKKSNIPSSSRSKLSKANNNAEYIPYSLLTLGGVRVSDIEKEISDIPNRNDITLSPILDKILSSRENSFSNDNLKKPNKMVSSNVLTTSDENLLQEVIDIEMTVSETLSKNLNIDKPAITSQNMSKECKDNDSYADDFEEEKSDEQKHPSNTPSGDNKTDNEESLTNDDNDNRSTLGKPKSKIQDTTFTKVSNLSFKNTVDIFEFVHSIDTQDTATQSNTSPKLPSETQTSPRNDRPNIQPIHNDLWPAIDPKGEVEKMFKLEKDFIKRLIIDEYGDLLEKNISKPSTSKIETTEKANNVSSSQKITQTSPAHVKSVMTSPTKTKTRMTSPFPMSSKVDHQTSPLLTVTNEEQHNVEIEDEDLGISVNLSSPRFSLRLPQNSREVLSNLENKSTPKINSRDGIRFKTSRNPASSSTSIDADNSSSELSSLGEVKLKLRRKLKKYRIPSISESSSSSVVSRYSSDASGGVLPLRSEGEINLGQRSTKLCNHGTSDGEISIGLK